jgi:hypothetical protein
MSVVEINEIRQEFNDVREDDQISGGDMQALYRKQKMITKLPYMKKSLLTER